MIIPLLESAKDILPDSHIGTESLYTPHCIFRRPVAQKIIEQKMNTDTNLLICIIAERV